MLPPYADTLGLVVEPGDAGPPIIMMPFDQAVTGRPRFLHGGAIGGLLEIAAIASLWHAIEGEEGGEAAPKIKPINVTIDFMRGGRDKETRALGIVTRLGNRVANVEAHAWQDDRSRPIASARMNYLIVRR